VTSRLTRIILLVVSASVVASAQSTDAARLTAQIAQLSSFDYATRTAAARMLRRAMATDVVPALVDAVRHHSDQFVRYRALVLLTGFNAPVMPGLMRELLVDRNDRVREIAYRWFEMHPDASLAPALLGALDTEQAEFVRPALIRAVAALPDAALVQRALLAEVNRGFDFFRSAVIEVLGEHGASYAADQIASIASMDGPLQDDAVIALGRIGGAQAPKVLDALASTNAVAPAVQAAQCLLGNDCGARIKWLTDIAREQNARAETIRSAIDALGALARDGNREAIGATVQLSSSVAVNRRDDVAAAFAGAAVRNPPAIMAWLSESPDAERQTAIALLHDGFERLEEDFAEEQFFAVARASYWAAADGSSGRLLAATLIDKLEF
jgi:HEAT repeat protein